MKCWLIACIIVAQYQAHAQELRQCLVLLADRYNELGMLAENNDSKLHTLIVDSTDYTQLTFRTATFNIKGEQISTTYLEFALNGLLSTELIFEDTGVSIMYISQPEAVGEWPYLTETTNILNGPSYAAWEDTVAVGPWPKTFYPKLKQWLADFDYCCSLYPKIISDTLLARGVEFTIPFESVSEYFWRNDDYELNQIDSVGGTISLTKEGLRTISSTGKVVIFNAKATSLENALFVEYIIDDENETHITVYREGDYLFIRNINGQLIYSLDPTAISIK